MKFAHLDNDNRKIEVSDDESILQASLKAGIRHTHACGGNAQCSTCRVEVLDGIHHFSPRNEAEQRMEALLNLPETVRLACQSLISGDVTIRRLVVDEIDSRIIRDQLASHDENSLGREKNIAVMFVDLANYTSFAESLPAYDVVHVLNRYYLTMNEIVTQHNGVISDVAGDGMLILFGACKKSDGLVEDAIACIRAMKEKMSGFNAYLQSMYHRSFGLRAGIHFGPAIIGHFSTGPMSKVAAIGDTVNMASRIEQANKTFGTQLLISEAAFLQVSTALPVGNSHQIELKGKSGVHTLHEVSL
ncbi:adenylate cyclase [Mariprofundus ferrinatatus]|uniref:Adenylate cyclase n=1 Tax=Mariprofundus ferrinatatus TaxID=1921087 RepID=A0A2K8L1Y2_9PROT|nr:adenylate/guanylate cyclase domain-containing protein [Mariprofundus ferrinatatus]ATX81253.1 adenylate cyclase [Mariprofundus ferrinatatus]